MFALHITKREAATTSGRGGGPQRPILRVNEPKKRGALSAKALYAAKMQCTIVVYNILLYSPHIYQIQSKTNLIHNKVKYLNFS